MGCVIFLESYLDWDVCLFYFSIIIFNKVDVFNFIKMMNTRLVNGLTVKIKLGLFSKMERQTTTKQS